MVSAMGKFTDDLILLADEVSPTRSRARDGHAAHRRRADLHGARHHGARHRGVESASFTGQPGRHHHRHRATPAPRSSRCAPTGSARRWTTASCRSSPDFKASPPSATSRRSVAAARTSRPSRLAAALKADVCEIYTDVTGVFSADPRVVAKARRLADGLLRRDAGDRRRRAGRVLMLRSVEFARRHDVPLHVRSSFTWEPGTWIVEEDPTMEEAIVSAITDDTSEAKITVGGVPDRPGVAATLFRELAERRHQRRHDRAEHECAQRHRHLLHRRQDRPRGRDEGVRARCKTRSAPTDSRVTTALAA